MHQYRIYRLDGAGRVGSADWVDAPSDAAAIDAVRARGSIHELWQGRRLVTRFAGDSEEPRVRASAVPARPDARWGARPGL
ncbi:MAG TPA: hypothetical protein VMN38_05645 [Sphingomicrobium sp.]|nr:hypothetical protein [Sphingomicrobium sp.]